MKRLLWTFLCLGWAAGASGSPREALIDSLERVYEAREAAPEAVDALLNLRDLTESSEREMHFARLLYARALKAGDAFAAGAALGSLAADYIGRGEAADSLAQLLDEADGLLAGSEMEGLTAYLRMVEVARGIQQTGTEESARRCQACIDSMAAHPPRDRYEEAAQLFLKGVVAYKLASADGRSRMERGLPYWSDELALLPGMRPTARRNFHANLLTCLLAAYSEKGDRKALMRAADDYLAMLDDYYRDPQIVRRRPYIPREMSYMVCYYSMCTSPLVDRRAAQDYYERYRRFAQRVGSEDNLLSDKRGFYSISLAYYERWGDYRRAMAYNDSLIRISRPEGMSALLARMYHTRASLLEKLGRSEEACDVYKEEITLRDSLSAHQYAQKVGELEVRYGLDKAERDKALLLAQKRQNTLWFAGVILLFALGAVVYLWRNLRRIRRLERNLRIESQRALESDRLKSDFMGSMSHEIRTPLNAINGFAELIADGAMPPEEMAECAQIIRDNTRLFTDLIGDMLEVSQLDNTSAELPRRPMDLCRIVLTELERLPRKEGVEYLFRSETPEAVVPLHHGYATELVRELLKNAVKFTERGTVTVACSCIEAGWCTLTVTDTGCGIAPEARERIFERFYKADPFAQGLGLGLSLCRLIVEKLGGTIRLDAEYTGGARFVVTLRAV